MRGKEAIQALSPCDNDLTDPTLQTVDDAMRRGPAYCSNINNCSRGNAGCVRTIAKQMAGFVVERMEDGQTRQYAIASEVQDYLDNGPDGKFWTFRNGKWSVVNNKRQAMGDIASFTDIIIG
jgi:hypothetical protein